MEVRRVLFFLFLCIFISASCVFVGGRVVKLIPSFGVVVLSWSLRSALGIGGGSKIRVDTGTQLFLRESRQHASPFVPLDKREHGISSQNHCTLDNPLHQFQKQSMYIE